MKLSAMALSLGLLAANAAVVSAQTTTDLTTQATTMNSLASTNSESNVVGKISGDFSSFLGADANAVVTGLRNGTPITLKTTTTTPPTGQMGYGNVYISLALAKQQLRALGIIQPTPSQLQAALTGGTITQTTGTGTTATTTTTSLDGILTLRSQNMGWGQIAQKLGYKLGPVMSSMKSANQQLANQSISTGEATTGTKSNNSGIVSAGGQSQGNGGNGISSGKGSGSGIVTASGRNGNTFGHGRSDGISPDPANPLALLAAWFRRVEEGDREETVAARVRVIVSNGFQGISFGVVQL
jgi:hypothetical protein